MRDSPTCNAVARVLENENNFIAGKAYAFLAKQKLADQAIDQAMRTFENRKKK